MKLTMHLLIGSLCLFLLPNVLRAQITNDLQPFEFKKRKVFYQGKQIKKPKEMASILHQANDEQASALMNSYVETNKIATGIIATGVALEVAGLVILAGADDKESLSELDERSKKGGSFVLGGLGVLLAGATINMISWKNKGKHAIDRYNKLINGKSSVSFQLIPAKTATGVGLQITF